MRRISRRNDSRPWCVEARARQEGKEKGVRPESGRAGIIRGCRCRLGRNSWGWNCLSPEFSRVERAPSELNALVPIRQGAIGAAQAWALAWRWPKKVRTQADPYSSHCTYQFGDENEPCSLSGPAGATLLLAYPVAARACFAANSGLLL